MSSTAGQHVTPGPAATRPGVLLAEAGLVAMAVIWGTNFTVVKYGAQLVSPLAYNGVRVTIAALVLCAVVALARAPLPPMRSILALLGLGVLGNGIYQFLFIEGVARTRASDAALVIAATPAFVALIGRMRGVERVTRQNVLGIILSTAGIALVVLGGARATDGTSSLTGDLIVLAAAVAWAAFTVLLKPYAEHVQGLQVSALTMAGGALSLLVFTGPAIVSARWSGMPTLGWLSLVYSAVFALVIAYYLWYNGVRVIGPTRTSMFSNLQPIIAVLAAWALLGETPTAWQGIGATSIMSGLLLTRS